MEVSGDVAAQPEIREDQARPHGVADGPVRPMRPV